MFNTIKEGPPEGGPESLPILTTCYLSYRGIEAVEEIGTGDHGKNDRQKIAQATRTEPPATGFHRDHGG